MNYDLTNTEKEIVKLVSQGFSNKEIAQIRHVAMTTVKTHLAAAYQKTNIANSNKGNDGTTLSSLVFSIPKNN